MEKAHLFALFYQQIPNKAGLVTIVDEHIIHRIVQVLRLQESEELIVFNHDQHAYGKIQQIAKKSITIDLQTVEKNKRYAPEISVLLPVLKKEHLEQAVYNLVEIGINNVQLVITQKSQTNWSNRDGERLQRIIISAAEQSKNFVGIDLKEPVPLEKALNQSARSFNIFFDSAGIPLINLMQLFNTEKPISFCCMVGPEGDLTEQEKELLKKHNFHFVSLTPTILRSFQAITIGASFIRSLIKG